MFTGIIDHTGSIKSIKTFGAQISLSIETKFNSIILGESIAVDGVCLTVSKILSDHQFEVQLSPETMRVTSAKFYEVGQLVNLERALALGDRMGGHFVTGHVDDLITVQDVKQYGDCLEVTLGPVSQEHEFYILEKGSVCLNGVSLTVNTVSPIGFQIMLIAHTLLQTTLKNLTPGKVLNIEYDWMAKLVVKQTQIYQSRNKSC